MKNFISGLYHFIIDIIMWLPCHPLRRLACRLLMKRFMPQVQYIGMLTCVALIVLS